MPRLLTPIDRSVRSVVDLAERQHGLVGRHQAVDLPPAGWTDLARSPDWEPVSSRVLRRRGAPRTDRQRALAACLDLGPEAVLSHGSAAALWGLPGYRLDAIEVTAPRRRTTSSALARVHRARTVPPPAVIDDLPVVRPAHLLLQLADGMRPEALQRRLDWMWSRRLLSGPSVRTELAAVLATRPRGAAVLREVLDALPADYVPPASGLEARFQEIVADHDLPRMRRQVDLGDDERWCGRVDFRAEDDPLAVEVQSDLYHRALSYVEDDARRRARLEAAGFVVVELTDFLVWHRAEEVADRVRQGWWATQRRRRTAR